MKNERSQQLSDIIERVEQDYLSKPAVVLDEAIVRLRDSLDHHGDSSNPTISKDAAWLILRMEELSEALYFYKAKGIVADRVLCKFETRFK